MNRIPNNANSSSSSASAVELAAAVSGSFGTSGDVAASGPEGKVYILLTQL